MFSLSYHIIIKKEREVFHMGKRDFLIGFVILLESIIVILIG